MIDKKLLKNFEKKYEKDALNKVVENAILNVGISQASLNHEAVKRHNFVFSDEIKTGEITNQKRSGRCWMFSGLNVLRVKTIKHLNVETFEYSESYLQFFDKIEKANTFLENIIETKDLKAGDRLLSHILDINISDGGYWNYFTGLVKKYGLVPKACMPETFHSSNTDILNEVLEMRLKKAASLIRKAKNKAEIEKIKEDALYEVYNICVKTLGKPVEKINFSYMDKKNKYHVIKDKTPLEFMKEYAPVDLLEMIEIVDDPRKANKKSRVYELPYSMSVYEYGPSRFLNVTLEELKSATIKSIKAGIPVWFACDVARDYSRDKGILDSELYLYDKILTDLGEFSKEDRLVNQASYLTHAMAFIGVDLDEKGNPVNWKVENSWGSEIGNKGIFSMSDDWFDKHTYSVVVDKKYISKKFLKGLEQEVIKLEYFDPIG